LTVAEMVNFWLGRRKRLKGAKDGGGEDDKIKGEGDLGLLN